MSGVERQIEQALRLALPALGPRLTRYGNPSAWPLEAVLSDALVDGLVRVGENRARLRSAPTSIRSSAVVSGLRAEHFRHLEFRIAAVAPEDAAPIRFLDGWPEGFGASGWPSGRTGGGVDRTSPES